MRTAVKVGLPVAVHAESDVLTTAFSNKARAAGQTGIRDYLDSRPIFSEVEAISRALVLAQETGCDLHIVHVSSVSGLARISEAKQRGIRVTAETCPHYLHFTDEALERLGAVAKCAPPLRSEAERQKLWQALLRGEVDIIASDHSPSSPDLKEGSDFFAIWGGIAGLQSSLNVLLSHAEKMALPLAAIAAMTSSKPASRFGFKTKGRLEPGYDADLCLVNLNDAFKLESKDLFYKHQLSPYCGESFKARVVRTVLRGKTIFVDGQIVADASGQFLQPTKNANRLSSAEIF
jgi:allantoinase